MMWKGFSTVMLCRCGVMSKGEKECKRSIDKSNAHYSKTFKSDRAHSEAAKDIKQVVQQVQSATKDDHLQDPKSGPSHHQKPKDLLSEGPVERFKEEQSGRENTLFPRKRRQLRKACEQSASGMFGCFHHAI
ncbi:hypothetical protein KC19_8G130600 [Ceratodon purpureus]|uniref:Uncharacterized protein n=1 Tax=Ceratodon purpureus TaxID=3225 RepID=A0A8T0H2W3_CERPU|nr:hypothetical protein KC19_8G130600 [Ceratodon purpureus]